MANLYHFIKPFLFMLSPEAAHNLSIFSLKTGLANIFSNKTKYENLKTSVFGLSFANPLGLAAGYDKDAQAPDELLNLGFGYVEVGTLTPKPQLGNPKPRLFRLKQDKAIINRMGFNNLGQRVAVERLKKNPHNADHGILGINIGANKDSVDKINDYINGITHMAAFSDYIVINISSPNTPGLRDLQTAESLKELLSAIMPALEKTNKRPPLLVKVAPDLDDKNIADIADTILSFGVDGLIVSNTTLSRPDKLKSKHKAETGGLSGEPLFDPSTAILKQFYKRLKGKVPIIGVGGISNAEQAYAKICAGASLIQIYSALIYEGPQLVSDILEGLSKYVKADGFDNISEAVGKDVN